MMEDKKNDLVLNMLANPSFSLNNFKTIGLTANNTTLLGEDKYLNSSKILNMSMFKDDSGAFNKQKFHEFYTTAKDAFNFMATDQYNDDFAKQARTYHRDNIFAPKDLRRKGPDFEWTKLSNPDRFTSSVIQLGKTVQNDKTWDELAQTQKVLANPIEATRADGTIDESKAIWHDSPNDSWFTDFFDTRVAAQWDKEGDHINPVTGEKEHHKEGDLKLNNDGNYYYENLEGRDVYGRRVLNKMNTLTTDGSEWNKYDFFDSDGYDKSVGGTIMKNAALAGSMFIPYVGPAVTFLSVANQSAGLLGTLGKMGTAFSNEYLGTNIKDNSLFNNLEGWAKSTSRQEAKSQYAQEHAWAMENLLGMVGDVMAQFKEQRFLFEKVPIVFKNKFGFVNNSNYQDKLKALEETYGKLNQAKMEDLIAKGTRGEFADNALNIGKGFRELSEIQGLRAEKDLDSYIKGYNKIGEILAKGYMTGVTVADTFGEAKNQGATDTEALWLTLGYGAGEAAILNTGVGEWLFPEMRYNKLHQEAVANALVGVKQETKALEEKMTSAALKRGENELKKDYAKRLWNIGTKTVKDLYTGFKSTGDKTIKAAAFNALGEGTEEVTEEFLSDFSKACFNGVEWLRGKETRLDAFDNGDWGNLFNRYAMNFVGGFIGGGAAGFSLDNMRNMKKLDHMEFDPAIQELIYMVRNGQAKEFLKTVDKMLFGDKNKSATKFTKEGDGYVWDAGTSTDNQDLAAKKVLRAQVKLFEDILQGEGILMSDDSFLSKQTDLLPDLKFALLRKSATAGRFLQEFNSLGAKLAQANAQLLAEKEKMTSEGSSEGSPSAQVDVEENTVQLLNETINNIKEELKTATGEQAETLKAQLQQVLSQIANKQDTGDKSARLEKTLKELRQQKEDLLSGKRAPEFLGDSLFEMTTAINHSMIQPSFLRYAEYKAGKKFNAIPENLKATLHEEWKNWSQISKAEQVHIAASIFRNVIAQSSPVVLQHALEYEDLLRSLDVTNLQLILNGYLNLYQEIKPKTDPDKFQLMVVDSLNGLYEGVGLAFSDEAFQDQLRELTNLLVDIASNLSSDESVLQKQIRDINLNESLSDEEKLNLTQAINYQIKLKREDATTQVNDLKKQKEKMITEKIINSIESLTDPYIRQGFANSEIKNTLSQVIDVALESLNQDTLPYTQRRSQLSGKHLNEMEQRELDSINAYLKEKNDAKERLKDTKQLINELSHTPIEQVLDLFTIGVNKDLKISELLKTVNEVLNGNSQSVDLFTISEDMGKQLGEAIQVMELLDSTLEAMKIDKGDLDNLYGYTRTINQASRKAGIQGYVDLAEISSDTANILLQDLSILKKKARFLLNLYAINSGQKLSEQKRVSVNKDFLFYRRVKAFVDGLGDDDDDWKGKQGLKDAIASLTTLEESSQGTSLTLPIEVQAKIDEETIKMEDAIFDFFKLNEVSLKSPKKLAKLLIGNIDLYDVPNGVLNSETSTMDDNSFFWWLATRAAVKSTDFHKAYSAIIDKTIAPIPTLELAAYQNFASVVNGDCFYRFYKGMREAIKEDWESKSTEERKTIIRRLNEHFDEDHKNSDDSAADDKYKDYPFTTLIVPKYSHIVFTEGIPGSGKTTGVYISTIKMIKNSLELRDAHLLDNVLYVYAAGGNSEEDLKSARENAKKGIERVGLDPEHTQAMSLEDYMKTISVNRDLVCTHNEDTGKWDVPEGRYEMTYEKEYRSKTQLKETDTPPTLVIIDEMTNVNQFDLDDINAHARKYGYSVLGAGDTDQSGVIGTYTIGKDGSVYEAEGDNKTIFPLQLYSANFPRTPKLGVSMRTNNTQKTKNLPAIQLWINTVATDPESELTLHYYQDETGIYGDKLYDSPLEGDHLDIQLSDIKDDLDLMLRTLKPREKIGYVTNNTGSELYEYLTRDEFKDKVELLPGTTSQGKEGQYYIVELVNFGGNYYKDLYTAITRSSQASLVFVAEDNIKFVEDKETHDEALSGTAIAAFSQSRKQILDTITADGDVIKYIPRTRSKKPTASSAVSPTPEETPAPLGTETPPITPEAVVPPIPPTSTPEPELPTFDPVAAVNKAIDSASRVGMTIGSLIDYHNVALGSTFTYTLKDIRVNESDEVIAVLDNGGAESIISFEDLMTDNYSAHKDPEPINEITNSSGITIKPGDWVLVYAEPEYGKNCGDVFYEVNTINDDNTLTVSNGPVSMITINADYVRETASDYDEAELKAEENKKYYQTEEEIKEEPVEQQGLDVIPPTEYQERIQVLNEILNPQPTISGEDLMLKLNTFIYSYNTFETGVQEDSQGYPVLFGNNTDRHRIRLDSVNGLMNLDKTLEDERARAEGRTPNYTNVVRKVSEYISIIGQIRKVIFNTKDKGQLDTLISNILNKNFGITGISTRFGFVSHAEQTKNGVPTSDGFSTSTGDFMRLLRHTDEDALFIHSDGSRAHLTMRKTISIEIARNGEDILELPLLSLSNPFTILAQGLVDPIIDITGLIVTSEDLDIIISKAKEIHDQFLGKYDGFVKLCQVYRGITDDTYYNIGDGNWTPCKVLKNRGVQVIGNQRGENYVEPGFEYDAPFIDIAELAKNPDLTISKIMYSDVSTIEKSDHSLVTIGGNTKIIKRGHPFVLVSTDPTLKGESDLVNAFKEDLINESEEPRVKLVYVMPPRMDIASYIRNMAILNTKGKSNIDDVGNTDTAFKLVKTLMEDSYFLDNVSINKSSDWIPAIQSIINDLSEIEDEDDLHEALMETRSVPGIPIKDLPTHAICKRFLAELGYPKAFESLGRGLHGARKGELGNPNEENINLISEILAHNGIDGVFYKASRAISGGTWGTFHEVSQNTGWTITNINGENLSYLVHGKIDTNQFEGDITSILDEILSKNNSDKMDYVHRHSVSGTVNPGKNKLKSVLDRVKSETGIDIDESTLGTNPLEDIAYLIMNNDPFANFFAFKIGKKLLISKVKGLMRGLVTADPDGLTEIASLTPDASGKAVFYITDRSTKEVKQAVYDSNTNEIEVFDPVLEKPSKFVFSDVTFNAAQLKIKNNGKKFLFLLNPLIKASNSVEFTDALQHLKGSYENQEKMFKQIFADDPDMLKNILDTIKKEEQQEQCAMRSYKYKLY